MFQSKCGVVLKKHHGVFLNISQYFKISYIFSPIYPLNLRFRSLECKK